MPRMGGESFQMGDDLTIGTMAQGNGKVFSSGKKVDIKNKKYDVLSKKIKKIDTKLQKYNS